MNVHVSYKADRTPEIEREIQHQVQKLGRRLQVFKPDLVHLHALIARDTGSIAISSLNLRLPTGRMAARRTGEDGVAAVKAAFTDLLTQVARHKELLRGHWPRPRRRAPGTAKTAETIARMPAAKADPRMPALLSQRGAEKWMSANLGRLKEFIDLELQLRVGVGQIREGQVNCEEVIDEVMVSALSRENGGMVLPSPESRFQRLALRAVQRLIRANADTGDLSLDAPAGKQNVSGSDENHLQYHQPDESLPEESVIGDAAMSTPEEIFLSEEMVAQLDIVLREVSTRDREAFVLYTLEGFTADEISRLSGRSRQEVRKSIQHAREWVRRKLPAQNQLRRSLLHRSHVS